MANKKQNSEPLPTFAEAMLWPNGIHVVSDNLGRLWRVDANAGAMRLVEVRARAPYKTK